MPRLIAVAIWFVVTIVLVGTAPTETVKLHPGACAAVGESAEWYDRCRTELAAQIREEQRPSMEDLGRRVAASALTLVVLVGVASLAERRRGSG